MLEKAYTAMNGLLRAILLRAQKKTRAVEQASVFLQNTYVVVNRMLVEIWTGKVIPRRSQMELRSIGNWKKGNPY